MLLQIFLLRLGGTKRASCACPAYQPAINMINMRVGGYVVPRISMRGDCGKQSTLLEESKRGRMKGAVAAGTI
jgi:hypothetical protein